MKYYLITTLIAVLLAVSSFMHVEQRQVFAWCDERSSVNETCTPIPTSTFTPSTTPSSTPTPTLPSATNTPTNTSTATPTTIITTSTPIVVTVVVVREVRPPNTGSGGYIR